MTKFKYLYSILFIVFFLVSNISIAQSKDSKPTLEQALREVFSESKTTNVDKHTESQKTSEKVNINYLASNITIENSIEVQSNNNETKKVTETTLKSHKGSSDLMKALREEFRK
ncbi:MAG: hypothetical protein GY936_11475 [Ignavibacteriae bacterium]|nr:hypothetical protein [Ignavibacteriota bacterium]